HRQVVDPDPPPVEAILDELRQGLGEAPVDRFATGAADDDAERGLGHWMFLWVEKRFRALPPPQGRRGAAPGCRTPRLACLRKRCGPPRAGKREQRCRAP